MNTTITDETRDVAAILSAGAALGDAKTNPGRDGEPYAIVPDGFKLQALPRLTIPPRTKGLVKLRDAASFCHYVNDHKLARTRIYALLDPAKFLCVFDDFESAAPNTIDFDEQADWRDFRAVFDVPASREWKTWGAIDRKDMSQLAFGEFLQDNLPDVVVPDSTDLLSMILNFEAVQGGKVIASQRLQDGSVNLTFQAENTGGSSVRMPELIMLKIPVFENGQPEELQARLRYRIKRDDGSITFRIELVRPHKVLEAAFRQTWADIERSTAVRILLGQPE
jgi:uncharacterized protein YfdQ (DUF2303 family)